MNDWCSYCLYSVYITFYTIYFLHKNKIKKNYKNKGPSPRNNYHNDFFFFHDFKSVIDNFTTNCISLLLFIYFIYLLSTHIHYCNCTIYYITMKKIVCCLLKLFFNLNFRTLYNSTIYSLKICNFFFQYRRV